jgi:hypothetical protein
LGSEADGRHRDAAGLLLRVIELVFYGGLHGDESALSEAAASGSTAAALLGARYGV